MNNIAFQNIKLTQNRFGDHNTHLEKHNPNLRPLYDMLDFKKIRAYIEQKIIEIAPIVFMRGWTLNKDVVRNTLVSNSMMPIKIDAYEKNKN